MSTKTRNPQNPRSFAEIVARLDELTSEEVHARAEFIDVSKRVWEERRDLMMELKFWELEQRKAAQS